MRYFPTCRVTFCPGCALTPGLRSRHWAGNLKRRGRGRKVMGTVEHAGVGRRPTRTPEISTVTNAIVSLGFDLNCRPAGEQPRFFEAGNCHTGDMRIQSWRGRSMNRFADLSKRQGLRGYDGRLTTGPESLHREYSRRRPGQLRGMLCIRQPANGRDTRLPAGGTAWRTARRRH